MPFDPMFRSMLVHLFVILEASSFEPFLSSKASPRAAFVRTLLGSTRSQSAPTARRRGIASMAVGLRRPATARRSATKGIKPGITFLRKAGTHETKETISKLAAVKTTPVKSKPFVDKVETSLTQKLTWMGEVDQPLLLTTVGMTTALAALWCSAAGGEYWTAASRAAVVATLRTMGADYATQLGKHKLDHEDGPEHLIEKRYSADAFQPDLNRTCSMGLFYSLYYIGPFSYVLTELYPSWFGNDGTWHEVWTKVLVENVLWMPIGYWILWSLFRVSIDRYLQRGQQHQQGASSEKGSTFGNLARAVWEDLNNDFWKKNLASFMFWGPADIFNFKFLPQYDVPTAMVVEGALWAAILGTIEYDQKDKHALEA